MDNEILAAAVGKVVSAASDVLDKGHHAHYKLSGHWWTNRDPHHHKTLDALRNALDELAMVSASNPQ